jgi:hypothetical protein
MLHALWLPEITIRQGQPAIEVRFVRGAAGPTSFLTRQSSCALPVSIPTTIGGAHHQSISLCGLSVA